MVPAGSVAWQFEQKGYLSVKGEGVSYDEIFMVAAEAGADDVVEDEGTIYIYTPRERLGAVEQALTDADYQIEESELRWQAKNETELAIDKAVQNMRLIERLEELDDVQSVASNLLITDDIATAFETA